MVRLSSTVLVALVMLWLPAGASATFPGSNGEIVFGVAKYDKKAKSSEYIGPGALSTVDPGTLAVTRFPDDKTYNDYEATWSPDGTRLAFCATAGGKFDGIYVGTGDVSKAKLVAKSKRPETPAWTPDGRTLLYADLNRGILSVPADGSAKPRVVIANPKRGTAMAPVVTPDGKTIVFERQLGSGSKFSIEIWAADADGANPRRLVASTKEHRFPGLPDISPDGTRLTFAAVRPGGRLAIWIASIDGAGPRVLASATGKSWLWAPAWSPDGTQIAASKSNGPIKQGGALVSIDAATGATRTLLSAKKTYFANPSWRPIPVPAA